MRFSWIAALCVVAACSSSSGDAPAAVAPTDCDLAFDASKPFGTRCGVLVDDRGRDVFLRGVNARVNGVFDVDLGPGRTPLEEIPVLDDADLARMRALGIDSLRLPIQWSGVEPTESGGFDEAYLDRVASVVDRASKAGIVVLVDLHQDAYSKEIGEDGAPYWAIVPSPPKLDGPLDDLDERRKSPAVNAAFDTFFGPSADGARLRTRFAAMAAHVAARFATSRGVLGLELFNEPLAPTDRLLVLHREVTDAVRKVAPDMLVFFEPSATRNFLDQADIATAPLGPGTVYAPHVYTLAFSATEIQNGVTRDAVERSYRNARDEADSWAAPLVVGEYGFPPTSPRFREYVGWHRELAEEMRASTFFWVWKEPSQGAWGFFDRGGSEGASYRERASVVEAFAIARLERAAGHVRSLVNRDGVLDVTFDGLPNERESLVSTSALYTVSSAACDDAPAPTTAGEPTIVTCGGAGVHRLVVRYARK